MVTPRTGLGQARILEAVIASVLMFIAFTAAFSMLFSSEKFFRQEAVDLDRLAHNVLHRLAESGVIDEAITSDSYAILFRSLQNLLPQNICFNLTIYERDEVGQWVPVNLGGTYFISNASEEIFKTSSEVASAGITYTSIRSGRVKVYYLCLSLTRAGLM